MDVIKINKKDNLGNTKLIRAVLNSDIETVEFLVNEGADVNIPNKKGWTALMGSY